MNEGHVSDRQMPQKLLIFSGDGARKMSGRLGST